MYTRCSKRTPSDDDQTGSAHRHAVIKSNRPYQDLADLLRPLSNNVQRKLGFANIRLEPNVTRRAKLEGIEFYVRPERSISTEKINFEEKAFA